MKGWHDERAEQRTLFPEASLSSGWVVCWLRLRVGQRSGAWKEISLSKVLIISIVFRVIRGDKQCVSVHNGCMKSCCIVMLHVCMDSWSVSFFFFFLAIMKNSMNIHAIFFSIFIHHAIFFFLNFIYFFGCVGSSLLRAVFL